MQLLEPAVQASTVGPSFLRRKRSLAVIFEPAACSLHCDVDLPMARASLERDGSERRRRNGEGDEVSGAESARDRGRVATRRSRTASGQREEPLYDAFALAGNRVVRVEPGLIVCSFKVPPRLTDRTGKLANGAIANLVDVVGISVDFVEGLPMNVSVDMSISYLSSAKLDDELEIISKRLGQRGGYTGTLVLVRNKATGEIIAEGRLSMFRPQASSKL